ncbi:hypothetical protein [Celeribacter naphthalenivorans]|uniref:hypothetical protein n=1 Tax=Celeribacter naphthalenivorans TaxID=1614694 RepID=UPI001CFA6269|nr:hypothetical protein [Celeribacter naphthalenivorans]
MKIETAIGWIERLTLIRMSELGADFGATDTYYSLAMITPPSMERELTRAILRQLTDKGLCKFKNGLFREDGYTGGSGYSLTDAGLRIAQERFVLIKGGYFYRPGAKGYTASTAEAGLFTKADATAHVEASHGAVTIKHIDECEEISPLHLDPFYRNEVTNG